MDSGKRGSPLHDRHAVPEVDACSRCENLEVTDADQEHTVCAGNTGSRGLGTTRDDMIVRPLDASFDRSQRSGAVALAPSSELTPLVSTPPAPNSRIRAAADRHWTSRTAWLRTLIAACSYVAIAVVHYSAKRHLCAALQTPRQWAELGATAVVLYVVAGSIALTVLLASIDHARELVRSSVSAHTRCTRLMLTGILIIINAAFLLAVLAWSFDTVVRRTCSLGA